MGNCVVLLAVASSAVLALAHGPSDAAPPAPPAAAVERHLLRAEEHLNAASAADENGRRALGEARVSDLAARAAFADGRTAAADHLAASVDELVSAGDVHGPGPPRGPKRPAEPFDAESALLRVDALTRVLLDSLPAGRARDLATFARNAADVARREAAAGDAVAAADAARSEAIARAAAHVAIAADGTLAGALRLPPNHRPKPKRPAAAPPDAPPQSR